MAAGLVAASRGGAAQDAQRLVVAEERVRIARELHDSAGHAITVILIQAGLARVLHARDPNRSLGAIETIEQVARETLRDLDALVGAMRGGSPAALEPALGLAAVPALVERHRQSGVSVSARLDIDGRRLPAAVDSAAYRIVLEGLTNAARHGTGRVEMEVGVGQEALSIRIENAVSPGAADRSAEGHGFPGMRERVALLGGTLEAARDGDLFRVEATLPYARVDA